MTAIGGRDLVDLLVRPVVRVRTLPASSVAPWALVTAALLPVVLISSWAIGGAAQPSSYSPVRQTVSVLAGHAAEHRWIVTLGLYLIAIGYVITALGVTAINGPARLALVICGIAALGVALAPEPAEGTSDVHALFTGLGAVTLTVWPLLVARPGSRALAVIGLRKTIVATAVSFGLLLWTFVETRDGAHLGLAERVSSGLQVCWPFVVSFALWRSGRSGHSGRDVTSSRYVGRRADDLSR